MRSHRPAEEEDRLGPGPGTVPQGDRAPLLPDEEDAEAQRAPQLASPRVPVLLVSALSLIFLLVLSTVFFGSLYYKLAKHVSAPPPTTPPPQRAEQLPAWPGPSHSLLGEYSTAAVAADNELCSEIGRDVLLQGGNAVEAAVAALFCIGVMDTQSAGLGGGHFMTIYNA